MVPTMSTELSANRTMMVSALLNSTPGDKTADYDPTGAMYFTVAVVLVYGLSIVALIATHMRGGGRDNKEESRQVSRYIQNQASMRRKGEQERLLWLQGELGFQRPELCGDSENGSLGKGTGMSETELLVYKAPSRDKSESDFGNVPSSHFSCGTGELYPIPEERGSGLDNIDHENYRNRLSDHLDSLEAGSACDFFPYHQILMAAKNYNTDKLLSLLEATEFDVSVVSNQNQNQHQPVDVHQNFATPLSKVTDAYLTQNDAGADADLTEATARPPQTKRGGLEIQPAVVCLDDRHLQTASDALGQSNGAVVEDVWKPRVNISASHQEDNIFPRTFDC